MSLGDENTGMEDRPQRSTGQRALVIVMGRAEGRGQKPGWDAVETGQERAEARHRRASKELTVPWSHPAWRVFVSDS